MHNSLKSKTESKTRGFGPFSIFMKTLYLDMDGVVADFDSYAHAVAGLPPSGGLYADADWALIASNDRLYRDLPKTTYADTLVDTCKKFCADKGYQLMFLTAVPKDNDMHWSFYDKVQWVEKYYPGIPVHFGPYSKDKHVHCQPGDILIDDRRSNIEEWAAVGGIAIHHQYDVTPTIQTLLALD